ncbi:hypothetical protein DXX93_14645 [Thalassotalea euphylliae]|uniref:DUF2798 domain-containing protein n=1 Tax=Thalassotalea euphylliae TaxID=1655234 RepID=A0A3E0TTB6_9GAMM|nr:hypothetical protein [Thalassotalea euphylliae]REL27670.1 hypothetical protein DXX93_14645 [Thalassotalea euphylliae]
MHSNFKHLLKKLPVILTLIAVIITIMTWVNLMTFRGFFDAWSRAFLFALVSVLPIGGLMFLALYQLIRRVFSRWPDMLRNLLLGVVMTLILQSIMALTTTASIQNFNSVNQFFNLYLMSFLYALPVGLLFASVTAVMVNIEIEQEVITKAKQQ